MVQVLLRARLGMVERHLGTDRINAVHRLLGGYLIVLVLAHATLLTTGYARSVHTSVPEQIGALLTGFPYVAWAVVAAALLVGVGMSSAPAVRHRIRHEVWHATHLLVYVALVLAFFHQVTVGEHFVHHPALRWGWTAAWLAVAVTMVGSRWLRPVWLALRHRLRITAIRAETPRTVSIEVGGRRLDRLPAVAGQYFRWRFLDRRRWYVAKPYSLSAEPDGRRLRITATVDGRYSSLLPELRIGTRVIAEGPCGGLGGSGDWDGPVLLIAGGIGITPLRALLASCPGAPILLVYRARSAGEIAFRTELDEIADRRGARVQYLVGSRDEPGNRLSAARLAELCPWVRHAHIYVCGSAAFVRDVRTALAALGARRIRSESFELA
jgi:ferredoxin-NADP reductase